MSIIVKTTLLGICESQINNALQKDHKTLKKLGKLDGRVLKVRVHGYIGGVEDIFIYIKTNGVHLSVVSAEVNEAWFEGSFVALIRVLTEPTIPIEDIDGISHGDEPKLLQALDELRQCFDYDWESLVYNNFSDFSSGLISIHLKSVFSKLCSLKTICCENTREYLQEEFQYLPALIEFQLFSEDVSKLEQEVDQLMRDSGWSK